MHLHAALHAGQPHRQRAGARDGPQARQPRAAARAEQPDDGGLLVRGDEGGRRLRRHHAAAAREGAHRHHQQGRGHARAVRQAPRGGAEGRAGRVPVPESNQVLVRRQRRTRSTRWRCKQPLWFTNVRHRRGRRRADRLHLGHHRQAEGHDAFPPRRDGDVRLLPALDASRRTRTTSSVGTPPLAFTFGLGGLLCFPMRFGASTRAGREAHARDACSRRSSASRRRCASPRRPCTAAWPPHCRSAELRSVFAEEMRLGRRGAARRDAPAVQGGDRHRDHRRHRLDRDDPHLHLAHAGAGAARRHRLCHPGLPGHGAGRGAASLRARARSAGSR